MAKQITISVGEAVNLLSQIRSIGDSLVATSSLENNPENRFFMTVFGSLYDYSKDIEVLVERKRHVSLPLVVRSFIDAVADMNLVFENKKYMNSLICRELVDREKNYQLKLNPRFGQIEKHEREKRKIVSEEIKKIRKEIQRLTKLGGSPLSVEDKYLFAGLSEYYILLYPRLSAEVHNNIGSYENRHVEQTGEKVSIRYDQEASEFDLLRALVLFCDFYFRGMITFSKICGKKELEKKLATMRASFSENAGIGKLE